MVDCLFEAFKFYFHSSIFAIFQYKIFEFKNEDLRDDYFPNIFYKDLLILNKANINIPSKNISYPDNIESNQIKIDFT